MPPPPRRLELAAHGIAAFGAFLLILFTLSLGVKAAANLRGVDTELHVWAPAVVDPLFVLAAVPLRRGTVRLDSGPREVVLLLPNEDQPQGTRVRAWPRGRPLVAVAPVPREEVGQRLRLFALASMLIVIPGARLLARWYLELRDARQGLPKKLR